jgi:hypothetical protein
VGGCTPNPKKLNPDSTRMAEAKLDAATTRIEEKVLGSKCLNKIRK